MLRFRDDKPSLVQDLHDEASHITGLNDFGDTDYRAGFDRIIDALRPMSENSWSLVRGEMVQALVCRLRSEESFRRNPAYRNVQIKAPLIITGLPRSGTTALHKLLSVDEQFQGLVHWLCEAPIPRPPRERWESYPAYRAAQAALEERHQIAPGMKVAHEVVVDEVDECLEVLRQDFVSNRYACIFDIPEYDIWFRAQDEGFAYKRFADILRLIGLNSDKKWLLKNPGHIANLDALLAEFPDAHIVLASRDPVAATASVCSVLAASQSRFRDPLDKNASGPRELGYWSAAWRDALRHADERPDQFIRIRHADFHAQPMQMINNIYACFGLELLPDTRERMEKWLAANPPGKHGAHVYDLETYGLTEADVQAAYEGTEP